MANQTSLHWADEASLDLGQAWGLSFLCTSFIEQLDDKRGDERNALHRSAVDALRHIAATVNSVAERCETEQRDAAPQEVRQSIRRAAGVSAVAASEAFTDFDMQYRNDITDWAINAVTTALETAKAALDEWCESHAPSSRAHEERPTAHARNGSCGRIRIAGART